MSEDGTTVTLKDANGKSRDVQLQSLCPDDNEYAKQWQKDQSGKEDKSDPRQETTDVEPLPQKKRKNDVPELSSIIEVSVGDRLDAVKASCQILSDVCDDRVNWRRLVIQPKNPMIETYTLYFFDSDEVGAVTILFQDHSPTVEKKITSALSSKFQPESEEEMDRSYGRGSIRFTIPSKPNESMMLSYHKEGANEILGIDWCKRPEKISNDMKNLLYPVAKDALLEVLKAPATAVFEDVNKTTYEITHFVDLSGVGFDFIVSVDAQNSYGAMIRTRYVVDVDYDVDEPRVDLDDRLSIFDIKRGETVSEALMRNL